MQGSTEKSVVTLGCTTPENTGVVVQPTSKNDTTAVPPQPISAVTVAQAAAELSDADDQQLQALARPLLVPLRPPAPGGVLPRPRREQTNRGSSMA
jgi:hypothetical protein